MYLPVRACVCVRVIIPEGTEVAGEWFDAVDAGVPVGMTDAGGVSGRVVRWCSGGRVDGTRDECWTKFLAGLAGVVRHTVEQH